MKPIKIGNVTIPNQLFLAPMVDVTDLAYRIVCRKAGAGMAYTEMLYADAVIHENAKTKMMMKTCKEDRPSGMQITGNSPKEFHNLLNYTKPFDIIDINCGCPSIRLIGNKAGSYLLKDPNKIAEMIKILKESGKPVTAKIRLGYHNNNVIEIAKIIEKAGADAITVHARLSHQGNNIPADWKWIKEAKRNIGIPVIGNGDIKDGKTAAEMLDIADGAMIGRAAIGNPLVFKQINTYIKTGKEKAPTFKQNLACLAKYLALAEKYDVININHIKYIGPHFFRNFEGASKLRNEFMKAKGVDEIKRFVNSV